MKDKPKHEPADFCKKSIYKKDTPKKDPEPKDKKTYVPTDEEITQAIKER